jgi:hypothetical protein
MVPARTRSLRPVVIGRNRGRRPPLSFNHMPPVSNNLWALYELARLGVLSGFRFRGPYWRWRLHTAFGRGYPASRRELVRSVLAYGRWIHQMRQMGGG